MTLKIGKALSAFNLAETVDLDCGTFEIRIRQAALHNDDFRAAVAARALRAKKKSLVPEKGTMTGSFDEDVELFLDNVIVGWGDKPLKDDDGNTVPYTTEVGREMFTSTRQGKILFSKVQTAATDDQMFVIKDEDLGNS